MISLVSLQAMTLPQRWELVTGEKTPVRPAGLNLKPCHPHYIGPLYTNTPFPHFPNVVETTSITLDDDNIYNGKVYYQGIAYSVTMTWKGYTTQLYDGTLKMCPIGAEADSRIEGVCNGFHFKFNGTSLEYGVWPGFIELYKE